MIIALHHCPRHRISFPATAIRTSASAVRIAPSLMRPASRLPTMMPGSEPTSRGHSSAQLTEPRTQCPTPRCWV
jgi:hypothetical protein